jgi:cytidyltransferase-like protein
MNIALATGGFDPIHQGHIEYLKAAAQKCNRLVVGLNSDAWLERKKGKPFMNWQERASILMSLEMVDEVIEFDDSDGTACDAIAQLLEAYPSDHILFMNGGDRTFGTTPERNRYERHKKVSFFYGIGGNDKKNSSSKILKEWGDGRVDRPWGYWRVLDDKDTIKVKELVITPHGRLSLQKHFHRHEHWYILSGKCDVYLEKDHYNDMKTWFAHESFMIPVEWWHQASNPYDEPCYILEVQYGDKCVEQDIERREDE